MCGFLQWFWWNPGLLLVVKGRKSGVLNPYSFVQFFVFLAATAEYDCFSQCLTHQLFKICVSIRNLLSNVSLCVLIVINWKSVLLVECSVSHDRHSSFFTLYGGHFADSPDWKEPALICAPDAAYANRGIHWWHGRSCEHQPGQQPKQADPVWDPPHHRYLCPLLLLVSPPA